MFPFCFEFLRKKNALEVNTNTFFPFDKRKTHSHAVEKAKKKAPLFFLVMEAPFKRCRKKTMSNRRREKPF